MAGYYRQTKLLFSLKLPTIMAMQNAPDQDDVLTQNPTGAAYDGTGSGATSGYGAASPDEDDDVDDLDTDDVDDADVDDIDDEDDDIS